MSSADPDPPPVAWTVLVGEQVFSWLGEVDNRTYEQVWAAIRVLQEQGPSLGRPLVDTLARSRHRNMKELRPGSTRRSEIRILFAFDKARRAVLLVAGDKSGNWSKWYSKNIPLADQLFDEHQSGDQG